MPFALQCALVGVTGRAALTNPCSRRIPIPLVAAYSSAGILLSTRLSGSHGPSHAVRMSYASKAASDISSSQALTTPHGVAVGAALLVAFPNG
jgi:hypothetical protein